MEFNKDRIIKNKEYSFDYAIKNANQRPIIIIIYNKSQYLKDMDKKS